MKSDIEKGFANKVYRALIAFVPCKSMRREPLTLQSMACRYGNGNVKLQMRLVMSDEEYVSQKESVIAYSFI